MFTIHVQYACKIPKPNCHEKLSQDIMAVWFAHKKRMWKIWWQSVNTCCKSKKWTWSCVCNQIWYIRTFYGGESSQAGRCRFATTTTAIAMTSTTIKITYLLYAFDGWWNCFTTIVNLNGSTSTGGKGSIHPSEKKNKCLYWISNTSLNGDKHDFFGRIENDFVYFVANKKNFFHRYIWHNGSSSYWNRFK